MAGVVLVAFALRVVALGRYPPGLHFDEAVYGLLARDILDGARPVFFSAYTGREPLYMYLCAALFAAIGPTALAIRLTSAFAGTATVALTFALGRSLYSRRVGLVAAGLVAVHYWHLTVSRNAYPNILIPPLESAAALCLWRAWRGPDARRRDWLLGGALTGLVLYTYLAARFWPVFLVVFLTWAALFARRDLVRRLPGIGLALAAALVVFAPLGWHFYRQPADFFERANQVLAWNQVHGSDLLAAYTDNVRRTAAGFLARGDPRWHYNLPGRPIFTPVVGAFFVLGVLACVRRWRSVRHALPVLWTVVLCLPGILTLEMQPAGQRIFGVLPAIDLLAAVGLVTAGGWIERGVGWLRRRSGARLAVGLAAGTVLAGAVIAVDGVTTVRAYFQDWARQPETYHIFNADYAVIARHVRDDLAAGRAVVVLAEHYRHPTIAFLAPEAVTEAVWADPMLALPVPHRGDRQADVVYYRPASYLPDDAPASEWLAAHATRVERIPAGVVPPEIVTPRSTVSLDVVRYTVPVTAGVTATGTAARQAATIAGEIEVATAPRQIVAPRDEALVVPVDWTVLAPASGGRGFALHLRDATGHTWAQADQTGYLASEWRAGDRVRQWFTLDLDPTMPPGDYEAHLILVDEAGHPLPVSGPRGATASWTVTTVYVTPGGERRAGDDVVPMTLLADDGTMTASGPGRLGPGLGLVGYEGFDATVRPGEAVAFTLQWIGLGSGPDHLAFALAAGDSAARTVAIVPVAKGYPPERWSPRELLTNRYEVVVPADMAAGEYQLTMRAASRPASGPGEAVLGTDDYAIGSVHIVGGGLMLEVPSTALRLDATLGDEVRLVGFETAGEPLLPATTYRVTLYWRADRTPASDAKVFVHLYARDGSLVAQHDGVPADGRRPLVGWLPGEVVGDVHDVPLPETLPASAGYRLAVGLYDPDTGERWPVSGSLARPEDRTVTLPVTPGPGGDGR